MNTNQELETPASSNNTSSRKLPNNSSPVVTPATGVIFSEQKHTSYNSVEKKASIIYRLVTKTGLVKNEKEANILLLIFAALLFILTIIIWSYSGTERKLSPAEEQRQKVVEEAMSKGLPPPSVKK